MGKILDEIKKQKLLISDGAWGTLLQEKGLRSGECPEEWNLTHPDAVLDIARGYVRAGADMIGTNSFGGSRFKLEPYGLAEKTIALNKAAAAISRKAATHQNVLGSLGPTGKMLMLGDITEAELFDAFKEQVQALESGGADAIMVETMTDLEEARIAVQAARKNTQLEVFATMTFEETAQGEFRTMMGVSPADMVETLIDAGADLIGANCGNGIAGMIGIVEAIRKVNSNIPVLIHANAGMPVYQDGQTVFPETPEEMASRVPDLITAGANIIGGCCGTTPDHISRIREVVAKVTGMSRNG